MKPHIQHADGARGARDLGNDEPNVIVGPEEKAAETRGQKLAGNIRLHQYFCLLKRGYNGDVIKKWTAHHAQKVIDSDARAKQHL